MKDINTATQADLEAVPLISPARAETIINWRENHGPISDISELSEISGIGEKMIGRITQHFSAASGTQSDDDDQGGEVKEGEEESGVGGPGEGVPETDENGEEDDENGEEDDESGEEDDESGEEDDESGEVEEEEPDEAA